MTKDFPERFNERCMRERNRITSVEISLKYFDPTTARNKFFKGDCTRYFRNIYGKEVC